MSFRFPEESVEEARRIARKYALRSRRRHTQAEYLYENKFLELHYGFSDALRTGKCGIYLHEAERDAECFSMAGIQYLIAREAGLEPRLYWASGMSDTAEGARSGGETEHAFITVRIGKDRFLLDTQYQLFGKAVHAPREHLFRVEPDAKAAVERRYSRLRELSEQEYVAHIERLRRPGGGRLALSGGESVTAQGRRLWIELDGEEFIASERYPSPYESDRRLGSVGYQLRAPVDDEGEWRVAEGVYRRSQAERFSWKVSQTTQHVIIDIPVPVAQQYIAHLEQAARAGGRKRTPLRRGGIVSPAIYFEKRGVSRDGTLTRPIGVDPDAHAELLARIDATYAPTAFDRRVLARSARQRLAKAESGTDRLYSAERRQRFLNDRVEEFLSRSHSLVDTSAAILDVLGVDRGRQRVWREGYRRFDAEKNAHDEQDKLLWDLTGVARSEGQRELHWIVDWLLFCEEHPLEEMDAPEEELRREYRRFAHDHLISGVWTLPRLELRPWRKQLKRLLAQ